MRDDNPILSRGIMAPVIEPQPAKVEDPDSSFHLNKEGTLAFLHSPDRNISIQELGLQGIAHGLNLATDQALYWTNKDPNLDLKTITLEDFLQITTGHADA